LRVDIVPIRPRDCSSLRGASRSFIAHNTWPVREPGSSGWFQEHVKEASKAS
jgi:hypothetical protein